MRIFTGLIILLSLLVSNTLMAQPPGGRPGPGGGGGQGFEIKGFVLDQDSDTPLEYATISIFALRDSSLVSGGITDAKGLFSLKTRPGRFYAVIEFLGYEAKTINEIRVGPKNPIADIGTVELYPTENMLNEIVVREEKSTLQMGLDKKVFNVGKDLASQGGSAAELLDNVPSIQVDIEGQVSLRGNEGVRILIDGRPSGLIGSSQGGLRSLQSNLIDRIEIITNPSARYEATGTVGIINIILKKDKRKGFNGSFDFTVGVPTRLGAAFNLNYRAKKFNFFTNYGISRRTGPGVGSSYNEFYSGDTTFITLIENERVRGGINHTIRFGADYYFNKKNTLTTAFSYRIGLDDNFAETTYLDYLFDLDNQTGKVVRTDDEEEDENKLEYSLNYKKTYDRKGQKWTVDVRYQDNTETEGSDLVNTFFNPDGSDAGIPNLLQRSDNTEGENMFIVQTDFVLPFSKENKFEVGGRASFRNIDNDFIVQEFFDNAWTSLEDRTNFFQYDENIFAAYILYGDKKGKFSYQVGLRPEYSVVSTKLLQTNEVNERDYINFFPSGHIGYELPNGHSVQLSYSRRVRRPRFWDLNPFFTFSDDRNFFSGNPDLDPEFTHSLEMGHVKIWDKASINSAVYYRHTDDKIQRIISQDSLGTTVTFPENLATEDSYGLEFNLSLSPVKWWRLNADFNFFRSIVDGENIGRGFLADTYSWFTRGTSRFTLWKKTDVQVRFNYRAPQETTQGLRLSMYSIDLGASRDIFKDKATLTLSVRDLMNSRRRRYESSGEGFFREGDFQWRARQATLTLNYRLNQKKRRGGNRSRGDYGGGEDFGG